MFLIESCKLLLAIPGWVHLRQQEFIAYLRTENQVLREKLGKKRILLDDDQRRRLAVRGQVLGRKVLEEFATLFSPDTIVRGASPTHRSEMELLRPEGEKIRATSDEGGSPAARAPDGTGEPDLGLRPHTGR